MNMIKVGIDAASFYTSNYYLDLKTLAAERKIAVEKFYDDLGQNKMAIAPPDEDIVTLAANAAKNVLQYCNINDIAMLLFATESSIDYSKAAGMYVHRLLGLPADCRVVELKQACYAATVGLQLALPFLQQYPNKKVLLIASDVARYELNSAAESSQGCGAVAMLLSINPRLAVIERESGVCAREVMDFWRPNYCDVAIVDGFLSCDVYLKSLDETWKRYNALSGRDFDKHQRFCYHASVPKLVEKAHRRLAKINGYRNLSEADMQSQVGESLIYSREIGNVYTASLFLSVISLLENAKENLAGKRIGLYSYGSGSMAEYFSAVVADEYNKILQKDLHRQILEKRHELSYAEYEDFYNFKLKEDGSVFVVPKYNTGRFRLSRLEQHKRIYEVVV